MPAAGDSVTIQSGVVHVSALTLDGLSYGHSSGLVQDKAAFIEPLATKRASFPSITLSDRSVSIVGHDAIARHV